MVGIGLGVRVGGVIAVSGGIDADAQSYFDRVTTAGGSLTTIEKQVTNQLVLDLKAASLWSLIDAAYPMVGSSAAAFAQNLKSSSFTGTFTSGWTYATTGATPNGTSAYMNTGYDQSANGSLNNIHISYYSRTNLTGGGNIGSFVLTPSPSFTHLYAQYVDSKAYLGLNSSESSITNTSALGFYIGSRIASGTLKLYKNNTTLINAAQNSVALPSGFVPVGATRNGISGAFDFGKLECAFASMGKGFTDIQAAEFYTIIQTFQTSLSRQV